MRALITGASGGLGHAYSHHLASTGHDIVLVSRRVEQLEALASELRGRYGVDAVVLPCDLADRAARGHLLDELSRRELTIDVLVNNAGFGTMGEFASADVERMHDEVELNCMALTHLTRALLPGMLERNQGTVINVASTAAFQPIPTMAVYAATKAYVLSLSEALWDETRATGVRITAICPGPTETAFFDAAGNNGVMTKRRTPEQVVESTFRALDARRPSVIDGAVNAVQATVARLAPARVAAPIARRVASPDAR